MKPGQRRVLIRLAAAGLAAILATSCSSHSRATRQPEIASEAAAATGHATIGNLSITGGYIPQPASPGVAAAYLTITNTGATSDTITKITTSVTASVMAMSETDHNGVGTMTDLHGVTIPAHGHISLTPDHSHLMLQNPTHLLRAGQHITATITFAHAGAVNLTLPVVPLAGTR